MNLRTSEPFWLVKNGIIHTYPSLKEDVSTDVLIVGGGITGSLIAHQLIKDGLNVLLIDRRDIGSGSTSATTSMLQYEIDIPLYKLSEMIGKEAAEKAYWSCSDAIDKLEKVTQEIHSNAGFEKKKSLYFAAYKKDVAWMEEEFEARKSAGFPVKWMNAEAIENKFGIKTSWGGILSNQGGRVDAFKLTHELLQHNQKKGLKIYDKTELVEVVYEKNKVKCKTNFGNFIKAKKIIYCNGYESTEMIKDHFVKLISTYAIIGEQEEDDISNMDKILVWNSTDPYLYLRTTEDNRLLIGGEDEDFVNAKKRDQLISKKTKILENKIKKILPKVDFRTDFSWAGTFGETKDGLPYIGKHPEFPSSYFVLGFGGNGITFSVTGMAMVSKHLKGQQHELEKLFRFRR